MAIQMRNKINPEFSLSSMSDLVFLLLIFFMLTSTLVSPNAIKLLLPNSNSKTIAKQTTTVYINDQYQYFIEDRPMAEAALVPAIEAKLGGQNDATIVLRTDKSVPVQYVVNVIDAVNQINDKNNSKHKVILATQPKD
ncbi:MAG TPA: biopolymer transporter ExbD [Bacteroidales bacterium]|nr:biopolymer transporter ExbD [Bacteroidales bacterium]HNZ43253.1 biopolymer transporter ExbD [Bacteroidales bacterium]HOH83901.1 biopolymer transporter ExbD [Bacteroidales bacterium]HPB26419.1 biopolymer transporter ExbD [Bacteroidales bacterium]HPI31289.1 biopolymer transporter ExbD [Bacteroidales bacterium]